jgi:hypothetical protein
MHIPEIIIIVFAVLKPDVSPTIRQNLKVFKTFDIIKPVSLVSGADFCYLSEHLTSPKFL